MEARVKVQAARLEELQRQEQRRQQLEEGNHPNATSLRPTAWLPYELSDAESQHGVSSDGFPHRRHIQQNRDKHTELPASPPRSKRALRSIDGAFVHILHPVVGSEGPYPHSVSTSSVVLNATNAPTNNVRDVEVLPLSSIDKSAPEESSNRRKPSPKLTTDRDAPQVTTSRIVNASNSGKVQEKLPVELGHEAVHVEHDPIQREQQQHTKEMITILENFHNHSRRCLHDAPGRKSDQLYPIITTGVLQLPSTIMLGGQRQDTVVNEPVLASAKEPHQDAQDSKLLNSKASPLRAKILMPLPLESPRLNENSNEPSILQLSNQSEASAKISLNYRDPNLESLREEIDEFHNFGHKTALEQMHTLLAELFALTPTQLQQPDLMFLPDVEYTNDPSIEEDMRLQEEDSEREKYLERAMGSVEYLRIRIGQHLQLLRNAYKEIKLKKGALNIAKQAAVNERLATQREKAKLLLAIDSNKYQWNTDSKPVTAIRRILSDYNYFIFKRANCSCRFDLANKG